MTGLYKTLRENLSAKNFEDLKIPMHIAVTNLDKACIEYFSEGELVKRIIASCTVPVIFQPVNIDGVTYVDGGVLDNLPLSPIENDCEMIIGVNVNPVLPETKYRGMVNVADRILNIALNKMNEHKIPSFDIYIEPSELNKYSMFEASQGKKMFDIGYKEARKVLKEKGY